MQQSDLEQHISRRFNEDLCALRHHVLHMGGLVERQLERAMRALAKGDAALAESVVAQEDDVDRLDVSLDEACWRILALRQPAACDLRLVIAAGKMVTDLERVGDEAQHVARASRRLVDAERGDEVFTRLPRLGRYAGAMLSGALDAFARLDAQRAVDVTRLDRTLDADYDFVSRAAAAAMMAQPERVPALLQQIWVARSLERIGDHARNICDNVVFVVHGKDVRHTVVERMDEVLGPDASPALATAEADGASRA